MWNNTLKKIFKNFYFIFSEEGLIRARKATEAIYSKDVKSLVSLTPVEMEQAFEGAPVINLLLSPAITVLDLGMRAKCFPTESKYFILGFKLLHIKKTYKNLNVAGFKPATLWNPSKEAGVQFFIRFLNK